MLNGFVAMALGLAAVGCTHDADYSDHSRKAQIVAEYNNVFVKVFGEPAADQDWGFGSVAASRGTRSQSNPEVPNIPLPYDEVWVADYLAAAKEPNSVNVNDNYDNKYWEEGKESEWVVDEKTNTVWPQYYWSGTGAEIAYNYGSPSDEDKAWFEENCRALLNWNRWNGNEDGDALVDLVNEVYAKCQNTGRANWLVITTQGVKSSEEGHWTEATEGHWVIDEDYVLNFKITDTWNGGIGVAASEGADYARTIVVTGTWNLTEDQRIGGSGKIIVANGGEIKVSDGKSLQFVNEGRFVVLPGGKVTGEGSVEVTNGNDVGLEGYNGGEINVGKFNNNFGKFYNYGTFKADVLAGGAGESNFYNHNLAVIGGAKENDNYLTPNTRLFNACQFYCKGDLRLRNYEGVMGSALLVDGELMCSGGTDGTTDPSYVALAAGALVKCGEFYNNGTSWDGPTTNGYAVLSTGKITYLNWADGPENGGYFANNIYVHADDWTNAPGGNGMAGESADAKFENVRNAAGNGNVTIVATGDYEVIPADDFQKGVKGCTPGFKITEPTEPETPQNPWIFQCRIFAEDLSASESSDFDFNDVVFDVYYKSNGDSTKVQLLAAGGTLPLTVAGYDVKERFGVSTSTIVNTGEDIGVVNGKTADPILLEGEVDPDDIDIVVAKGNTLVTLTAHRGEPASKFAVKEKIDWAPEYHDIKLTYPDFGKWVSDPSIEWWKNKQ